ncbi:transcription initiation factor IIA, gamma subunit [Rhizodiscina lignyota]|uniref:Transcription initiation factor IIA subunit 2 n=1 Tax=Rhizodiscina lignyota TaxID=1504668 RepID=A0A9P4MF18_9PEZI|nr:transcription initiation factor IIA, gamma subunit [Rhizodiscina lignyota]
MSNAATQYYELYRRGSLGTSLADVLDDFVTTARMEPQLANKMFQHFDKHIAEVLGEKVKARMSFKGHLDTYRFCDDVWTFIIKDVNFKLDNSSQVASDKVKIVAMNAKKPGEV